MRPVTAEFEHPRVAFQTLGCKLNQAETELMARQLQEAGCMLVNPDQEADIFIVNTCTVTHVADRKSRHFLRMAKRRNPAALVVATGCFAGRLEAIGGFDGVDLILGNQDKLNLKQILTDLHLINISGAHSCLTATGHTRSFIRIQDGCSNYCSYCIVPFVRGTEKSLPAAEIINQIRQRLVENYQEVVLTGTEIGRYHHDGMDLAGLIRSVLGETGIQRVRLSSLQPQEITASLIDLWQDQRLCRHFHLSLQSGSGDVLKRMNRRYTPQFYRDTIDFIRSKIPGVAITTDVIVGFPGETEKEFEESRRYFEEIGFSRIHVFPYSLRKGTAAAGMSHQIDPATKRKRTQIMLDLSKQSLKLFNQKFIGQILPVLFEQQDGEYWAGLTDNYLKVYVKSDQDLTSRICPVKCRALKGEGILGEIVAGKATPVSS